VSARINSKDDFQAAIGLSAVELERFEKWQKLLNHWNNSINLVQKDTISQFWTRHALDSAQLFEHIPKEARRCLDLGAGAGFPGLALAIMGAGREGFHVDLVESNGKKISFLRTVIRELSLPANALKVRAEEMQAQAYDVISARAFAPLPSLLDYAAPFWAEHTLGIFPKGRNYQSELDAARESYNYDVSLHNSRSDDEARILVINSLSAHQSSKEISCA
jgi:16S rRNA (guanine527-N7)-methyltransferase